MTWLLILHSFDKEKYSSLLDYCKRASFRDRTFQYRVEGDRIIIQSLSRDQAYKRGTLLHYRFGCYYEVTKME